MKKNELNELKTKTVDELKLALVASREALVKATNEKALGKAKNTNALKSVKKDIARIMTFLSMKEEQLNG